MGCGGCTEELGGGVVVSEEEKMPGLSPIGRAQLALGTGVWRSSQREGHRAVQEPSGRAKLRGQMGRGAGGDEAGEGGRTRWRVPLTASCIFNNFLVFPPCNFCCF